MFSPLQVSWELTLICSQAQTDRRTTLWNSKNVTWDTSHIGWDVITGSWERKA